MFRKISPYVVVVALTSIALLDAQIAVTRLLSYRFFYHYVFFIVSLAQLGLAAAGALVYWKKGWVGDNQVLIRSLIAMSLFAITTFAFYIALSPEPNLSFAKADPITSLPYLIILAIGLVGFNFAGGIVLTLVFTKFREVIGRLYAADLIGASIGCVISVWLMWVLGPPLAFLLAAALPMIGVYVLWGQKEPGSKTVKMAEGVSISFVAFALIIGVVFPSLLDPNFRHDDIKGDIIRTDWTHIARVDAMRESRYIIDGDASTDLYENEISRNAFPEYALTKKNPDVAIIGVGAGPDLKAAVGHDARSILAVDINPTILKWAQNDDAKTNEGIYHRPEVSIIQGEGRHALRSSDKQFDLIVMYAIDTWTASSQGAYSLTENFLYTTEAVSTYWSKLKPDGLMSIRRWLFNPPRETLRLFTTVFEGLKQEGVSNPENHMVVVAPPGVGLGRRMAYLMFSRAPLAGERLAQLDQYLSNNGYQYLFRPGTKLETLFSQYSASNNREAFIKDYPYVVSPSYDENPFFFIFQLPWKKNDLSGHFRSLYSDSTTVLFVCLLTVLLLTAALLAPPLWARRHDLANEQRLFTSMLYFGGIGAGFMGVELVGIQTMTLFLGHPTYALSVVLMGLLAFAGLGSYIMQRLRVEITDYVLIAIVLLILGSSALLLPMVHYLIDLSFVARLGITFLWLFIVGIALGMPFVGGIRSVGENRTNAVAWAWACNGASSVIGSNLIMILMVFSGSRAALLFSAAAYIVAFLMRRRLVC